MTLQPTWPLPPPNGRVIPVAAADDPADSPSTRSLGRGATRSSIRTRPSESSQPADLLEPDVESGVESEHQRRVKSDSPYAHSSSGMFLKFIP